MQLGRGREGVGLLIGLVTLLVVLSPLPVFFLGLFALSAIISYEVSRALGYNFFYVGPATLLPATISLELGVISAFVLSFYSGWKRGSMEDFLKGTLLAFYAGLLPSFLILLKSAGEYEVFKLLLFVWAVDVFSYYTGRRFGRRALAPRLSPKKTWEGLVGGGMAGLLVLVIFHGGKGILFSPLLTAAAVLGDLYKSSIKRMLGIKDFSNLLGEHGGFTDRFDSLLFASPIYLFLLKF